MNKLNPTTYQRFPLWSAARQEFLLLNIVLQVLGREIRPQSETKDTQIGKEEVKLSLFTNDMTFYIENPKNPLKMIRTNTKQQ